jgi:methylenetetrahydrofolate dehydrogenase (NADP+) / methenyltetrahydrofolate cyclohydrolase / formyltetrahydrofolate synthetase
MALVLQSNLPKQDLRMILNNLFVRSIRENIRVEILEIQKRNPQFKPALAIIQVGERPDSNTYVRMKGKAALEVWVSFNRIGC